LLSMKPGITGYAQIKWRDALSFDDEANFDLHYMQHWSLWFDLYVLFMTIGVLFKGR
jgi:lipopolysaccharide/colanic/teichoic acid biosynthesis glycosyltransferase